MTTPFSTSSIPPSSSSASLIPLTPTKPTVSALAHMQHPTPRGLHTVPQPFHFHTSSSKHSQTPRQPQSSLFSSSPHQQLAPPLSHSHAHPSTLNKENVSVSSAAPKPMQLLPPPSPSAPLAPPTKPTSIIGSRTPQSLFSARHRLQQLQPRLATTPDHADTPTTRWATLTAEPSAAIVTVPACTAGLPRRRLEVEFAEDATSLAEILQPSPTNIVATPAFTTSDRQSMLVTRAPLCSYAALPTGCCL